MLPGLGALPLKRDFLRLVKRCLGAFAVRILELTSAAGARALFGAAVSGANNDITSMSALVGPGLLPVGSVIYHAANSAPTGFFECNGAAVSRTTYAALFTAIGTTWGVGDGSTTFNLPELRGEFIRVWDNSRGVDAARAFASAQGDAFESHSHTLPSINSGIGAATTKITAANTEVGAATGPVTGTTGDAETRPRNVALMACIKF